MRVAPGDPRGGLGVRSPFCKCVGGVRAPSPVGGRCGEDSDSGQGGSFLWTWAFHVAGNRATLGRWALGPEPSLLCPDSKVQGGGVEGRGLNPHTGGVGRAFI